VHSRKQKGWSDGPADGRAVGRHSDLPLAREHGSGGTTEWMDEAVSGWGPSQPERFCPGSVVRAGRYRGWPTVQLSHCRRMRRERMGEGSSALKDVRE
jgi:hypothetical protein